MKIALLIKKEKPFADQVINLVKNFNEHADIFYGSREDPFPTELARNSYDYLISYIGPWIVPKDVLKRTKKLNINFHPGPPSYPGTGCFNFALYNEENEYGSTAHVMDTTVDTGTILMTDKFKMSTEDDVVSLSEKTYSSLFTLFNILFENIKNIFEIFKSLVIYY